MKKILFTLMSVCIMAIAANAQATEVSKEAKAADKEAKAKQKQLMNENIDKALKQVGASDKEIAAFKEASQTYSSKGSEIRKDASLSDADKEAKLKANSEEKNAKLKEILSEAKYKEFSKIRKEQKVAEEALVAPAKQ
jgi:hypothetical protein